VAVASEYRVECNREIFRQNFNRLPHEVRHTLAGDPLFQIPALAALAQRVAARKDPHHTMGDAHFHQGPQDANTEHDVCEPARADIADLVKQIETGQTWVILKHIEREPGYREVFESCLCDLMDLAGKEIVKKIKWFEAVLFITSPNRVTKYHIDRECSWLLQIQGNKEIHFFDRADKEVLPDADLERYWTVKNLTPAYKAEYESHAMVYRMQPGTGVHSPVNTPHWLQNGDNVSVSLSINFQWHEHAWENLYRANYFLRRLGVTPASPGKYPARDRIKMGTYTAAQAVRRGVKGLPKVRPTAAREDYYRIVELLGSR
jgi:hypothetical protein